MKIENNKILVLKLTLLVLNIVVYGLGIFMNFVEFMYNYNSDIFDIKSLIFSVIFSIILISLIFILIKKIKYYILIATITFASLLIIGFNVLTKPHGDGEHYYVITGRIISNNNQLNNDTILIQPVNIGDLIFDCCYDEYYDNFNFNNKIKLLDSLENYYINDTTDVMKTEMPHYGKIINGNYRIYGNYFCDTEIDIRSIKRLKEFPVKIFLKDKILKEINIERKNVLIIDSGKYTLIKFPQILLDN